MVSSEEQGTEAGACSMVIRLSENFRAVFYAPFYATIALGHYRDAGLDVRLLAAPAPGTAAAGLLDGTIDVTWGGPMRVMKARNEPGGPPLLCFCEVVRKDPFYLVGRRGLGDFRLQDLARLKLASVSEAPTPWLCLQHDLREGGIDPGRLDRISDRTMAQNLEALGRGEIDVAQVFEPYAAMAVRQGIGEIVHAASARGLTSYTTLLAVRPSVERLRGEFAAMRSAIGRTLAWLAGHSAAELAEVVAAYFPGVAREDLVAALQRYREAGLWSTDTGVTREGFQRLAVSLQSGGFIARVPAYDDCVVDV
jgi:NitT/TauT family transport system substrate-binding protein